MAEKVCTNCEEEKSTDDFVHHRKSKDGFSSWCKKCHCLKSKEYREKNLDKVKAAQKQYKDANPRNHRRSHLRKTYGIELEDYETLLADQGGGCAICGRTESNIIKSVLAVDHIAGTLKIRGLLCFACNAAIGLLDHDPERLVKAMEYLAREPVMEGVLYPRGIHRDRSYVDRGLAA